MDMTLDSKTVLAAAIAANEVADLAGSLEPSRGAVEFRLQLQLASAHLTQVAQHLQQGKSVAEAVAIVIAAMP